MHSNEEKISSSLKCYNRHNIKNFRVDITQLLVKQQTILMNSGPATKTG